MQPAGRPDRHQYRVYRRQQHHPGMGFAIPINMARTIADQIVNFGDIRRGSLGLTFDDLPPDALRDLKLTPPDNAAG